MLTSRSASLLAYSLPNQAFRRGSVIVTSVEVLWALSSAVCPNGKAKIGEQDMNVRYGFTDQHGVVVTVKVLAD